MKKLNFRKSFKRVLFTARYNDVWNMYTCGGTPVGMPVIVIHPTEKEAMEHSKRRFATCGVDVTKDGVTASVEYHSVEFDAEKSVRLGGVILWDVGTLPVKRRNGFRRYVMVPLLACVALGVMSIINIILTNLL